jgi:hypothetical protein
MLGVMQGFGRRARWLLLLLAGVFASGWVWYGYGHVPRRWSIEYVRFGGIGGEDVQVRLDSDGAVLATCPRANGRTKREAHMKASASDLRQVIELLDDARRAGAIHSAQWSRWLQRDGECRDSRAEHLPTCECLAWSLDVTYWGVARPLLDTAHPSAAVLELSRLNQRLHDTACS